MWFGVSSNWMAPSLSWTLISVGSYNEPSCLSIPFLILAQPCWSRFHFWGSPNPFLPVCFHVVLFVWSSSVLSLHSDCPLGLLCVTCAKALGTLGMSLSQASFGECQGGLPFFFSVLSPSCALHSRILGCECSIPASTHRWAQWVSGVTS